MPGIQDITTLVNQAVLIERERCATMKPLKYFSELQLEQAVLAERERCTKIANKWAEDKNQSSESRLVAAYIRHDIRTGK